MKNTRKIDNSKSIKNMLKGKTGITLVALVVTIVVLLILAGVTITALLGDDGIIKKAQNAADSTNSAVQNELDGMNSLTDKMNSILNGNGGGGATLPTDGSYNETKGVNTPKLGANMTLVKFDTETQDWVVDETNSTYSYKDTGVEGANTSEWANAKVTVAGIDSYFVWIPRYAYKINGENDIDIKFIKDTGNTATDGTICKYADDSTLDTSVDYIIHPAFTTNADLGGGWEEELPGIWVGKYETARSDTEGVTEGSATTLKVQPGVTSFRNITIGNMYTYSYNYARDLESHMLKNSEWGAVAYLTESKYGRNGTEVAINNSSSYITGSAESTEGTTTDYTSAEGVLASSTGNVYGIYDLSGGVDEYVAGYFKDGSLSNGSIFADGTSDEYSTAYTGTSASSAYIYGDATYETNGWHSDVASFVSSNYPFFIRGGNPYYGSNAGVFCCIGSNGSGSGDGVDVDYSFRLALVV